MKTKPLPNPPLVRGGENAEVYDFPLTRGFKKTCFSLKSIV